VVNYIYIIIIIIFFFFCANKALAPLSKTDVKPLESHGSL